MAKKVTLADISARVGVSTVAVSKALSGKAGVSDELRKKIQEIADELGYVSNKPHRVVHAETGNIGVVVPGHYYGDAVSFYGRLYEKVVRALYDNQYFGILELLTHEDEKAGNIPKVAQGGKVDGLIFLGQLEENYVRNIVDQVELPVFFLDTYASFIDLDTVISDGYFGTYQLTNYLIKQGHSRIAYVGSVDATSSIADRYWGYRRSLRENNISFESGWEIPDRDDNGKTYEKILDSPGNIDAYVCNCDYTARILIRNLEEAGYRVPDDYSVVGFDNFLPATARSERQITSYEVDMERMASICVKSLIKKIKYKKYVSGIQIVTGKIVTGETVKSR